MLILTNKSTKIHVNLMLASQGLTGTNNLILSLINSFVRITKITTMAMLLLFLKAVVLSSITDQCHG